MYGAHLLVRDSCIRLVFVDMKKSLDSLLSVFCGAGGLDLGFEQAGFDVAMAFDIREDAITSYNANRPESPGGRYMNVRDLSLARLDALAGGEFAPIGIIGGPPCQSFSRANRSQSENDPRHELPFVYADLIRALNTRNPLHFFVLENVLGLKQEPHVELYEKLKLELTSAGFRVYDEVIDARSFGVPQKRERIILVGINSQLYDENSWLSPQKQDVPTHELTVAHAFRGLPEPIFYRRGLAEADIPFHPNHWCMSPKSPKFTTPGALVEGRRRNRSFKTLSWAEPSVTVAYGNREVHIHPTCKRRLSVFEAMRLQGFPDKYCLKGSLSSQITQVSEAVPPPVAKAVAESLALMIQRQKILGCAQTKLTVDIKVA
jgi:DNA (cytosine-5)-methyltransferase 1